MNRTRTMAVASSLLILVGCTRTREQAVRVQPTLVERAANPSGLEGDTQARWLEETWGIRVESAMLSAGGYMVDFRFRVLDAAKAAPILDRRARPYLIDQASNAQFIVPSPPKIGQLRSGGIVEPGRIYFIFFANPGKYIKSGNKVTIVIDDFRARDIVVQ